MKNNIMLASLLICLSGQASDTLHKKSLSYPNTLHHDRLFILSILSMGKNTRVSHAVHQSFSDSESTETNSPETSSSHFGENVWCDPTEYEIDFEDWDEIWDSGSDTKSSEHDAVEPHPGPLVIELRLDQK